MAAQPCGDCGSKYAMRIKHLQLTSGAWVTLVEWMWLCRKCAGKRRKHAEQLIARR